MHLRYSVPACRSMSYALALKHAAHALLTNATGPTHTDWWRATLSSTKLNALALKNRPNRTVSGTATSVPQEVAPPRTDKRTVRVEETGPASAMSVSNLPKLNLGERRILSLASTLSKKD